MDQQPRTLSASAPSAQRPIAPQLGATPADRMSGADALDEQMVRAMIEDTNHKADDKEWLVALSYCREALRPITSNITQKDWDRRPAFND
eukprot:3381428-Pyramimonas_sp.AAC.1